VTRTRSNPGRPAGASSHAECFDSGNTKVGGEVLRQDPGGDEPSPYERRKSAAQSAAQLAGRILLDDFEAAACFGVSRRKFLELRNEPWMVKPVVLGPRLVRWPRAELEAAIANMPRQQEPTEPASLRRARIDGLKRGTKA
jgi:predicted DNA-binding transcriptional regulator AlpA